MHLARLVLVMPLLFAAPAPGQFRLGAFEAQVDGLSDPAAAAVDDDGLVYVADATAHRVVVIDRQGRTLREWGGLGAEPGRFRGPAGIAVGGDEVFVSDGGNHRVQVFDRDGAFLREWGGLGAGPGAFNGPAGLAVDGGTVYVADSGNDRVQAFGRDGALRLTFGADVLNRPVDVSLGAAHVFVADADNNRIQRFLVDGTYVDGWGDWGPFVGLLDEPRGVAVHDDVVFVADTRNHRVQLFEPDGALIDVWGMHSLSPREGEGRIHYPNHLAIAPDGAFAVICEAFENRIQIFAAAGPDDRPVRPPPIKRAQGTHFGHYGVATDRLLVIGEPEAHSIDVFRIDGDLPIVVTRFGGRGTGYHQLIRPAGIVLGDEALDVIVADSGLRRIQVFRLDYDVTEPLRYVPFVARLVRSYDLETMRREQGGPDTPWPIRPGALCRHRDGRLFVADPQNAMIHMYDADMRWLDSWGGPGTAPGALGDPCGIALSVDGEVVFVVDGGNQRVQAFGADGTFSFAFGAYGEAGGEFLRPQGIAAGVDGLVYVSDAGAHSVSVFTEKGEFVRRWGAPGYQDREFWKPAGIAQAPDGRLFVIDYGNHRTQVFGSDGDWRLTFGFGRPSTPEKPRTY